MKILFPVGWRYGNYGGPGHSGEAEDPLTQKIEPYQLKPVDGLDTIFRDHDLAYGEAEAYEKLGGYENKMKALEIQHIADKALVEGIKGYDPYNDPLAREGYTDQAARDAAAAYAFKANNVFQGIINQREDMYPGLGTKPIREIMELLLKGIARILGPREAIAASYDAATQFRPSSPITFDLDGDGIETLGMVRQYASTPGGAFTPSDMDPIMFDHNGDGVKVNTGWIGPDDGMLVYDRNGNGMIDNGTELFGDSTLLYAGGTAADGFAALAQEDTNGDGSINHLDANRGNLRIWRDLDSDGMSDGGELFTLDELGITGINVNKTNITQNLANGNRIIGTGTFTKADGTTGSMGDVWFRVDTFTSEFTDSIPVSEEVRSLPNMQGSGLVRDLQEAATQSLLSKRATMAICFS